MCENISFQMQKIMKNPCLEASREAWPADQAARQAGPHQGQHRLCHRQDLGRRENQPGPQGESSGSSSEVNSVVKLTLTLKRRSKLLFILKVLMFRWTIMSIQFLITMSRLFQLYILQTYTYFVNKKLWILCRSPFILRNAPFSIPGNLIKV